MSKFRPRRTVSEFTSYDSGIIYTNSRPGPEVTRNRMRNQRLEHDYIKGGVVPGGEISLPAIGSFSATIEPAQPRQYLCNEWVFTCEPARDGHWNTADKAREKLDDVNGANPVMNYRFNAEITTPAAHVHNVPGFFAGDGNGNGVGNKWKFRYSPSSTGEHTVVISFEWHEDLDPYICFNVEPLTTAGTHQPAPHGYTFTFNAQAKSAANVGYFASGHLQSVGERLLKFTEGTNNYHLKTGMNSPENWLGYKGFDGTVDYGDGNNNYGTGYEKPWLHTFDAHKTDWESGDPEWGTGIGSSGIIGAVNSLASSGCNSIYLMPMNLQGDAQDTSPFAYGASNQLKGSFWPPDYNLQYMWDVSKLEQWSDFFEHCQEKEISLHIALAEREAKNVGYCDDPADWESKGYSQADSTPSGFGVMRRLYYKQLFAWFGCLPAIQWTLCEEQSASGYDSGGSDQGDEYPLSAIKEMGSYLSGLDFYGHSIGLYSSNDEAELLNQITNADHWGDVSGWLGHFNFHYTSTFADPAGSNFSGTQFFLTSANEITQAATPPKTIAICAAESQPAGSWLGGDEMRQRNTWPALLTSGTVEYYIGGPGSNVSYDQHLEDFTGQTEDPVHAGDNGISALCLEGKYARDLLISAGNYWDFVNYTHTSSVDDVALHVPNSNAAFRFPGNIFAGDTATSSFIFYAPRFSTDADGAGTLELSSTLGLEAGTLNFYFYNPREGTFDVTGTITTPTIWAMKDADDTGPSTEKNQDWALLIKP